MYIHVACVSSAAARAPWKIRSRSLLHFQAFGSCLQVERWSSTRIMTWWPRLRSSSPRPTFTGKHGPSFLEDCLASPLSVWRNLCLQHGPSTNKMRTLGFYIGTCYVSCSGPSTSCLRRLVARSLPQGCVNENCWSDKDNMTGVVEYMLYQALRSDEGPWGLCGRPYSGGSWTLCFHTCIRFMAPSLWQVSPNWYDP